jgi:hypothetical protein
MIKYIPMEINNIVQEEIKKMLKEQSELLGLAELGDYLSRTEPNMTPEDGVEFIKQNANPNDYEAIRKFFREQTGTDLQILGNGKFAFKL